jgi:hypothetical protein
MRNLVSLSALGLLVAGCSGHSNKTTADLSMAVDMSLGSGTDGGPGSDGMQSPAPFTVASTVPANGATAVSLSTPVVVAFSEGIDTSSLGITLTPSVALGTPTLVGGDTVATFTPATALAASTAYTMTVVAKSKSGASLAMPVSIMFTTAAVADTTPPTVTMTPPNGSVNVATSTNLVFTFSKTMDISTVAISAASTIPFDLGPPTWTVNNTIATFTMPPQALTGGQSYTVTVDGKDVHGNALATANFTLSTVAPPLAPPQIVIPQSFPDVDSGSESIATNSSIVIDFTRAMNPATFVVSSPTPQATDTFKLQRIGSALVACDCAWSAGNTVFTCTPHTALAAGASFEAYLNDSVAAASDGATLDFTNTNVTCSTFNSFVCAAGSNAGGSCTGTSDTTSCPGSVCQGKFGHCASSSYGEWFFGTQAAPDTTPPTVVSTDPPMGATGISITYPIKITFSKRMDQASLSGAFSITSPTGLNGSTPTWDPTGTIMTYQPSHRYPYGATVSWQVGTGAKAYLNGLGLASTYTSSFTTLYEHHWKPVADASDSCSGFVYSAAFSGDNGTPGVFTTNGTFDNQLDVGYFTRTGGLQTRLVTSRGFFCFPLPKNNVTTVLDASILVNANGWSGNPSNLGYLFYENVHTGGALSLASYSVASTTEVNAPFMTSNNGVQQQDITPLAISAIGSRAGTSYFTQVRLQFEMDTDSAGLGSSDGFNPTISGSSILIHYTSTDGPND